MKNSRWISRMIVLAIFLCGGALAGHAQQAGNNGARGEKSLEWMKKNLDLTDAQASQVEALNTERKEEMKALKAADTGDKSANRDKMKNMNDSYEQKLKTILTDAQWATYTAKKEERKEKRKGRK